MENYSDIINELGNFGRTNNQEIREMVYQSAQLTKHTRKITKVNGRFPAIHSVIDSVVKRFSTTWSASGTTTFKVNDLKDFRMKVNYPIIVADIQSTWIGETMYDESTGMPEQTIAQYIINKALMPAVVRDLETVMGKGDVASADALLQVMDGLATLFTRGIAVGGDMFKVPLTGPITVSNALDTVQVFEDTIDNDVPQVADSITKIFMSSINRRKVLRDDKATNGKDLDYTKDGRKFTYEGNREIIGLNCLNGTDWIFATPEGNLLELMDITQGQMPRITDIQKQDYELRIFMEWFLGLGFWTDQLVFVSNFANVTKGLANNVDNQLYYGKTF